MRRTISHQQAELSASGIKGNRGFAVYLVAMVPVVVCRGGVCVGGFSLLTPPSSPGSAGSGMGTRRAPLTVAEHINVVLCRHAGHESLRQDLTSSVATDSSVMLFPAFIFPNAFINKPRHKHHLLLCYCPVLVFLFSFLSLKLQLLPRLTVANLCGRLNFSIICCTLRKKKKVLYFCLSRFFFYIFGHRFGQVALHIGNAKSYNQRHGCP